MSDFQRKRWILTFDNVDKHGIDHDLIKECVFKFNTTYFCLADEKTEAGMLHTHLYFEVETPTRFSTVKNRFPSIAHIDAANGTGQECRDYVRKEGKYLGSEKATTSMLETFEEWGTMRSREESSKINKAERLLALIEEGYTNYEILKIEPSLCYKLKDFDRIRSEMLWEKYRKVNRPVEVHYLFGPPGCGKTRSIMGRFSPDEICRITSYKTDGTVCFDGYTSQDVLVFEEYHSQINIEDMLNILDIYPLTLTARYSNRCACYTQVFITSNLPLSFQYPGVRHMYPEQWRAFLRRITDVTEFDENGNKKTYNPFDMRKED